MLVRINTFEKLGNLSRIIMNQGCLYVSREIGGLGDSCLECVNTPAFCREALGSSGPAESCILERLQVQAALFLGALHISSVSGQ